MTIAVTMVRDEDDIIGYTLRHLLAQPVDRVVVADNLSTDHTSAILDELARADGRLVVVADDTVDYRQGDKMSALIAGHAHPGEWVVPFDADELWTGLANLADLDADLVKCAPYVHVPNRADDESDRNPCTRIVRRQPNPEPQPKVCFRWQPGVTVDIGNHAAQGVTGPVEHGTLDVRHFQYRTLGQVRRKVRQGSAALDAAGYPRVIGTHWRDLAAKTDDELAVWWDDYQAQRTLHDPAPYLLPCRR